MKIGLNPLTLREAFFPGADLRIISPGREEAALWEAAGTGEGIWCTLPDGRQWSPWEDLVIVDEAHRSQYDGVLSHLRQGSLLPSPVACIALTGSHFHGQRNRSWEACRGNLHLTVHLTPRRPVKEIGHGFTLLPAVACIRTIRGLTGGAATAGIKWVNDIVVGNRKVGGFLAATQIQDGIIQSAVIGLGINIHVAPPVEPTPFVPAVACLRDFHPDIHLAMFLPALLSEFAGLYKILLDGDCRPLLEAYREYAVVVGRSVRIWQETADNSPGGLRTAPLLARGVVSAINDDLSLVIEGRQEPISRGRLAEEEECRRYGI